MLGLRAGLRLRGLLRPQRRHRHRDPRQQQGPGSAPGSGSAAGSGSGSARPEPWLLQCLVCPLSRRPLRYEEATQELVNEELGIAYPITDGIPSMVPEAARRTRREPPGPGSPQR